MRRQTFVHGLVVMFWLLSLPASALCVPRVYQRSGAARAAKTFYQYHFLHDEGFDEKSLRNRRKWLTSELYGLLLYERRRKVPPDTVPYMEGDPFTFSQERPDSYRIGKPEQKGAEAKVQVFVYWHDKQKVIDQRKYSFVMARQRGRWRISDIIDHEGESLLKELKELKSKDGAPK